MPTPRVFVAGATGATGRTVLSLESKFQVELVPHARAQSASSVSHTRLVSGPLEGDAVAHALKQCTTVMQLIGTMRKRFSKGDTYESSDIGTTRTLVEAAKQAGVTHFILLSSTGAGSPTGAYLKAKAAAEALVRNSGISFTILRPSAFEDREGAFFPGMRAVTELFGMKKWQPIKLRELASALLQVAEQGGPANAVLEGQSLWDQVKLR